MNWDCLVLYVNYTLLYLRYVYIIKSRFSDTLQMSLIYIINKKGLRIDPMEHNEQHL